MSKLRIWSGLIRHLTLLTSSRRPATPFLLPHFTSPISQSYSTNSYRETSRWQSMLERDLQQVDYQCQREYEREREERVKAGLDTADIDAEENEDYLNVTPILEKYKRREAKPDPREFYRYEPTDSESEDDERMSPEEVLDQFNMKLRKREDLLHKFSRAGNLNDAYQCMKRIDKFEEKHLLPRPEYRVIGELMNRLKVAEGKEKFLLQMKLNRALRMVECKEAFDPNDPANYGVFRHAKRAAGHLEEEIDKEQAKQAAEDDDSIEFDDMKEKDNILLKKLSVLDKKLESKLAELDHTFGKKGKLLEEEIRDLAEERNSLTELKRKPLYRKGFDMKLIDVNRTCKVTKGGQVVKYTVMLACGNYNGVVGYAKAKGPKIPVAIDKAREKCFQNLHYVERHEDHTIAHAIHTSYKKTKVYLWPAPTQTDMKAGKTVLTILNLAGFKNVKSKVIGSRNPHNTVKAVFKALNEIETPKDVQEKFGRTVVESYLL